MRLLVLVAHLRAVNLELVNLRGVDKPRFIPPPRPEILLSRAEPPALIFASRRSLRMRACSAALEGGVLASDEAGGGVSAMLLSEG